MMNKLPSIPMMNKLPSFSILDTSMQKKNPQKPDS